ncbi:MAG: Fe-Mn family superoxide dismutase [Candidatus Gracilibacteria bacterium]|nr:Fe-Mn family superoxide dismutase [Candidatus Gracilibacteria bacterium]
MFKLPELPYEMNDLEPYISAETLEYHYGKHHKTYVDNLNNLTIGSDFDNDDLENLIKSSQGPMFNNAAQVWNHTFYWNCLAPNSGGVPKGDIVELIERDFESFEIFKEKFTASSLSNFGSGWTWLVLTPAGRLEIVNTSNAGTTLTTEYKALLVVDVWEHAYYIDTRNARAKYLENFWNLVNWDFVNNNLK